MLAGGAISWSSKQQTCVAQSSVEAEYVALSFAIREALWLQKIINSIYPMKAPVSTTVYGDNQGCISLAKNGLLNERSKDIDIKYQFIFDNVEKGSINLQYVQSADNLADLKTKALPHALFYQLVLKIGMKDETGSRLPSRGSVD